MVFFTCNHCGESVKKPSVEKHYFTKCRGLTKNVSCMDCLKDFHGEAYVEHTKCITEAEKYSGKDYVPKESKNSNAKKQESWTEVVHAILDNKDYKISKQAREVFERLQSYENVPRKQRKFENFISKCVRVPHRQAVEVWNVLEKELEKMKQNKLEPTGNGATIVKQLPTNDTSTQNGNKRAAPEEQKEQVEPAKKKSKKQKAATQPVEVVEAVSTNEIVVTTTTNEDNEFLWNAILEKIVSKHADGVILDKLKSKVLKKYKSKLGLTEMSEKQQQKFDKKFSKNLKRCIALQLQDNIVKCC